MSRDDLTDEQKMLEKPVKGYQLRELTNEVSDMKDVFLKKFDVLTRGIEGVATITYVESIRKQLEDDFVKQLDERDKRIHLRYGPFYKGGWWVAGAVAVGLIGLAVTRIWG